MSVALQRCSWLSKIYSDSKSRVSEVKNSRNIFTLFLPQSKGPFSKTVRESCPQIRVRLQNYQYQTPRSIGFDGEVFYNVWQEMEPPQLVVSNTGCRVFKWGEQIIRSSDLITFCKAEGWEFAWVFLPHFFSYIRFE